MSNFKNTIKTDEKNKMTDNAQIFNINSLKENRKKDNAVLKQ